MAQNGKRSAPRQCKPGMSKSTPNRLSLRVLAGLGVISLIWLAASAYIVPRLIASAYHGHSLGFLNRLVAGQAAHPLAEYLADWRSTSLHLLLDFWFLGLILVLVLRPEFHAAVWGNANDDSLTPFDQSSASRGRWQEYAFSFVFYLVVALICTLPNSIHPTRALLGRGGDNYLHAWFLWEFARAVAQGTNPFHTDLILSPLGANLSWATTDILGQIIAVPFSLLFGSIITYNITLVLQLALSAFFARLLCRHVCGDARAATIGGIVFGFSPFLLTHAWGHLSLVTAFPLPLYALVLGKLLDKQAPTWKDGALLGMALALVALANYEYTVICGLFTVCLLLLDFGLERAALLRRLWAPLATSALIFLLCLSKVLFSLLTDYHKVEAAPLSDATSFSADLFSFFIPSLHQSFFGRYVSRLPANYFVGPGGIEGIEFTGLVALALAAVGCWVARGKQRIWAGRALIVGVVFAVLSLGPTIHILGRATSLPSPAAPLYRLSAMRFLREPARISIMTTLSLALLASLGMAFLLNKISTRRKQSAFLCVIAAAILLEYLPVPFPSSSIVEPARYWVKPKTTQACLLPPSVRDGAVLTVPMDDGWYHNNAMWMQMMDGGRYRLIAGRVSPYVPGQAWSDFVDNIPALAPLRKESEQSLASNSNQLSVNSITSPPDTDSAAVVRQLNLRAVVVFDAPERPTDVNYVRQAFGGNEMMVGDCVVFELPSSAVTNAVR